MLYKNIRNSSWKCLIDNQIMALPVSLKKIARISGIKIIANSVAHKLPSNVNGMTIYQNNTFYIIFNDLLKASVCRFTIAHEIGHIVLKHTMTNSTYGLSFTSNKPIEESEADIFAIRLLAPACILHEIGASTAEEIMKVCNISYSAASIRAERMQELMRRNKWYADPLERQVKKQFQDFINSYK